MEKLTSVLWRERELLESLLYRLEVEELIMSSGRTRWLSAAAREVEEVVSALREVEILRSVATMEAGDLLGLGPDPRLSELIEAAEEPWRSILGDHRETFLALTDDIARVAQSNRALIVAGLRATQDSLFGIEQGATTYTARGSVDRPSGSSAMLDRSL